MQIRSGRPGGWSDPWENIEQFEKASLHIGSNEEPDNPDCPITNDSWVRIIRYQDDTFNIQQLGDSFGWTLSYSKELNRIECMCFVE